MRLSAVTAWPEAARPLLQVETRDAVSDGVPVRITELAGSGIRIRVDAVGGWDHSNETSNRSSILLAHRTNPNTFVSFAIFSAGEFLGGLEKHEWQGYVDGLREQHADRLLSFRESGTVDGGDGMFVFGRPYREVAYTTRSTPDAEPVTRREVFVFVENRLLVITLTGTETAVAGLSRAFELFVARLELIS